MPRIKQKSADYAQSDFWKEIMCRQILKGIRYDRDLAAMMGLQPSGYCIRKKDAAKLSVRELQQLVAILKPDPIIVLKLLGYSGKDIPQLHD